MAFTIPTVFTAIDRLSGPVGRMRNSVMAFADQLEAAESTRMAKSMKVIGDRAERLSRQTAVASGAILLPMGLAASSAIDFEERMSDVAKTTGLSGAALDKFGAGLLGMVRGQDATRTTIEDLQKIGEIGGQLGVAKEELLSFTEAANKFSVALGSDYSGGVESAVSSVSKLKSLFEDTRKIPIAEAITRTGSAINQLGAVGNGTSENINDFMLRIGTLPDAIKPSLTNTAALGAFFEETGIDAQIAAGGLSNFLLVAGQHMGDFAGQMRMSARAAADLLATDPTEFSKRFATSLNSLKPEQMAQRLAKLHIGSQESIKVLGALGANTQRLTDLQGVSAEAYAKGSSLQEEYNTKNSTTAAKLAIARNNFQALSITVGTKLVPMISKLIDKVMPTIQSIGDWIGRNEALTSTILTVAGTVGGTLGVISAVSGVISIITKATWLWTAAQRIFNLVMSNNPIGWVMRGIIALIAIIKVVSNHTTGWGETWDSTVKWMGAVFEAWKLSLLLGWQTLKHSFLTMTEAIVEAWKWGQSLIGNLSDEQYRKDLAQIAERKRQRLDEIRTTTGELMKQAQIVNKGVDWQARWVDEEAVSRVGGTTSGAAAVQALNPKAAQAEATARAINSTVTQKQEAKVTIEDRTGTARIDQNTGGIAVKLTSTVGQFGGNKR